MILYVENLKKTKEKSLKLLKELASFCIQDQYAKVS